MQALTYEYKNTALVSKKELQDCWQQLESEIANLCDAQTKKYDTQYASINLPDDSELRALVHDVIKEKQNLKPAVLVVLGIGGSHLGAHAIHQALFGTFYNEQQPPIKIYFVDTTDVSFINDIIFLVEQQLQEGKVVLLNVISKSGTTTETIVNFYVFLNLLKRYQKESYKQQVIVTTNKDSELWKLAQQETFSCLLIPEKVGGRYSVFSPVGLFPLGLLGVDINKLLDGATQMRDSCLQQDFAQNVAAVSASVQYIHYQNNIVLHDTFVFSKSLQAFGLWYRQLVAESLGKINKDKKTVGIMPTVSVGSSDLHSVAQLYLGGPNNRFTTFITIQKQKANIIIPENKEIKIIENIANKSMSEVMQVIITGTQTAYYKQKRPFDGIELPEYSVFNMGQLLQWKMIEIMYLGKLLEVDPFDQPHVELYKKEVKKLLF